MWRNVKHLIRLQGSGFDTQGHKKVLGLTASPISVSYPKALRTHILRLLGPKTILYKASGLF